MEITTVQVDDITEATVQYIQDPPQWEECHGWYDVGSGVSDMEVISIIKNGVESLPITSLDERERILGMVGR